MRALSPLTQTRVQHAYTHVSPRTYKPALARMQFAQNRRGALASADRDNVVVLPRAIRWLPPRCADPRAPRPGRWVCPPPAKVCVEARGGDVWLMRGTGVGWDASMGNCDARVGDGGAWEAMLSASASASFTQARIQYRVEVADDQPWIDVG